MAKRVCDLCDLNFEYPCKYKRHLESASHKRFSKSLTVKDVEPPMAMLQKHLPGGRSPHHQLIAIMSRRLCTLKTECTRLVSYPKSN